MAKKRKSDASRLDEVDRSMYATFCTAANSLSQLYTHAMHQQKLSFQAGERHSMEKIRLWILQQLEEGTRVMGADVVTYLQAVVDTTCFPRSFWLNILSRPLVPCAPAICEPKGS